MADFTYTKSNLNSAQLASESNGSLYGKKSDETAASDFKKVVYGDSFWNRLKPNQLETAIPNWNRQFPYQLIIVKKEGDKYRQFYPFTLPIPPENMTISMPFAINTIVTLGGIVEEHNGAPLRMINFTGTTGVLPLKGITPQTSTFPASGAESLFAGTISAARNVANSARGVADGTSKKEKGILLKDDISREDDSISKGSGYYQFRLLQRFFEAYATMKKSKTGRDYRLVWAVWKDQALYIVTPVVFNVQRSAASPYEYQYNIQLKAWKRIENVDSAFDVQVSTPVQENRNWVQPATERLEAVFDTILGAEATIKAVRADADRLLFEPIRSVAASTKALLNIPITLLNLPKNIIMDARKTIEAAWSIEGKRKEMEKQWTDANITYDNAWREATKALDIQPQGVDTDLIEHDAWNAAAITNARRITPSTTEKNDTSWTHGQDISGAALKVIGLTPMSDLKLTPTVMAKINEEKNRVANLTQADYQDYRNRLEEFMRDYGTAVGASTLTYDATFGRADLADNIAHLRDEPTDDDYAVLWAINDAIMVIEKFLVEKTPALDQPVSALEYIGGLANRSGIAFTQPVSKFGIPFPYGTTLERLAARYLGDANRWHEIAALNGLRSPYVDEVGFRSDFVVSGSGNQVIVAYTKNLYVGQPVWIYSSTMLTTKRNITGLEPVGSNLVVSVSGDRNMGSFRHDEGAYLRAYLPDTINSQQLIYIPSPLPSQEESFRSDKIPSIDSTDALLKIAGIDLLLTSDMDLIITPDGDGRWSYGMNNLVQRLKIGMSTPVGSLLQHPDYGVNLGIGMSIAELNSKELLDSIQRFVATDPAFTGVSSANIVTNGGSVSVAVTVGVNGVGNNIPIITTLR